MIEPRQLALACAGVFLGVAALYPGGIAGQKAHRVLPTAQPTFEKAVLPVVTKFCAPCHSGGNAPLGIVLTGYPNSAAVTKNKDLWARVDKNVANSHMPPDGAPAPTKAQRDGMVRWLDLALNGDCKLVDPGHVTMRRLNRREYDNTIRDLVGLDLHLSDDFPSDDVGYGFDNIGDVLSISPLLMEKYMNAAEVVAGKAIQVPDTLPMHFDAESLKLTQGVNVSEQNQVFFSSEGQAFTDQYLTMGGNYRFKIEACGQQAGPEIAKLGLLIDNQLVQTFVVAAVEKHPDTFETTLALEPGKHHIALKFLNDYYRPGPPVQDRNLIVRYMDIYRPALKPDALPDSEKKIIFVRPTGDDWQTATKQILTRFASRAFRRPATSDEVGRLMKIAAYVHKDGQPFERSIQLCVQAILSSPQFLFLIEKQDKATALNGYELASRLSYFLWGSMPDDRLMQLAGSGELQKTEVLKSQVRRMLLDPKSSSLADNFAEEWFNLRKLALINPDPAQFKDFSEQLRADMMTETKMFFTGVVQNDRSILDFLDGKYTYVDERLAKHYGIPGVEGDQFRRVSLAGTPREGILTQGSILTLTSNPTRTSPVKRGKWVLEEILNTPPPPPPPNVGVLPDDTKQMAVATLREKMEQHRKNPACATCHKKMDPLGFSLENFDATGAWRAKDGDVAIDSSGVLPDGTKFHGAPELTAILMKKKDLFVESIAEKLLTYALGRGVESFDKCSVDRIASTCEAQKYKFSALVDAVVTSDPFRKKRVGGKG